MGAPHNPEVTAYSSYPLVEMLALGCYNSPDAGVIGRVTSIEQAGCQRSDVRVAGIVNY